MRYLIYLLILFGGPSLSAQDAVFEVYKQLSGPSGEESNELRLEIYPAATSFSGDRPAIIWFFGGGWSSWNPGQFREHARYFARLGVTSFLAEYRVKKRHGTDPFTSLRDAKSAMRHVRYKAKKYGINPGQIVAAGGSAGGHLAAALAYVEGYNEESDDLSISTLPHALMLFNPVLDQSPSGYGHERIGEAYHRFSPLFNLKQPAPPSIVFIGTEDHLVPVETIAYYARSLERLESSCEVKVYPGEGHGFFNVNRPKNFQQTLSEATEFLRQLSLIE